MSKKELEAVCEQVLFTDNGFHLKIFSNEGQKIEEKKYTKCFDCDKIKDGLVLRTRRSGDYLRVTAKGGKKKLKDYMIDAKIPKEERDSILLLADGPEIWWVVGYRRGESGRVGEDTKAVLQIQIGVGKEENR